MSDRLLRRRPPVLLQADIPRATAQRDLAKPAHNNESGQVSPPNGGVIWLNRVRIITVSETENVRPRPRLRALYPC
jgi:hypothetical protein